MESKFLFEVCIISNQPNLDFYSAVFEVVRNFKEYNSYKKKKKEAVSVIHKKFSELDVITCEAAFDELMNAYNEGIIVVEKNKLIYWEIDKNKDLTEKAYTFEEEFFKKYENIPKDVLQLILDWIFYWYHKM